jgi:hypothetical protein
MKKPKVNKLKSKSIGIKPGPTDVRRLAQGPSRLTDYSKQSPMMNPDDQPIDLLTMPGMMSPLR